MDDLPKWIKEKETDVVKNLNLDDRLEFKNNKELKTDFLAKLISKEVSGYQQYCKIISARSLHMGV